MTSRIQREALEPPNLFKYAGHPGHGSGVGAGNIARGKAKLWRFGADTVPLAVLIVQKQGEPGLIYRGFTLQGAGDFLVNFDFRGNILQRQI